VDPYFKQRNRAFVSICHSIIEQCCVSFCLSLYFSSLFECMRDDTATTAPLLPTGTTEYPAEVMERSTMSNWPPINNPPSYEVLITQACTPQGNAEWMRKKGCEVNFELEAELSHSWS
uniref:Uncharacterized protein n=2 Tax=Anopheles albimanus TaxID=7167 RepID=A0A182FXY8_ANOAL